MQINNLRYSLSDKLISVQDVDLLEKINILIGNVDISNPIFKITKTQKVMLEKSEIDIENGNFITDEELNEEEDKWLNRESGLTQPGKQGEKFLNTGLNIMDLIPIPKSYQNYSETKLH